MIPRDGSDPGVSSCGGRRAVAGGRATPPRISHVTLVGAAIAIRRSRGPVHGRTNAATAAAASQTTIRTKRPRLSAALPSRSSPRSIRHMITTPAASPFISDKDLNASLEKAGVPEDQAKRREREGAHRSAGLRT
jgi:hypothetical protein